MSVAADLILLAFFSFQTAQTYVKNATMYINFYSNFSNLYSKILSLSRILYYFKIVDSK